MTDHRSTKLERVLEVAELCHGTCYFLADLRAAERELQTCSATLEQEDGDADLKIVLPLTAHGAEIEAWEFELHSIETASVEICPYSTAFNRLWRASTTPKPCCCVFCDSAVLHFTCFHAGRDERQFLTAFSRLPIFAQPSIRGKYYCS